MNVFTFTGNLGRDAQVRQAGGTSVAGFSVAVKSGYGDKAQTLWLDCSLWGSRADSKLVDYLVKGQQVAVSGELGTREHEGKTYLTCRVNDITLVGKRDDNATPRTNNAPKQSAASAPQPVIDDFDEDIPF